MESYQSIKITVTNHKKIGDHFEYFLQITLPDGSVKEISDRYSNLKVLNDALKKEWSSGSFPKFPPKKFFFSSDEKYLQQRQNELKAYFEDLSERGDLGKMQTIKKYLEEKLDMSINIIQTKNNNETTQENNHNLNQIKTCQQNEQNTAASINISKVIKRIPLTKEEVEKEEKRCQEIIKEYDDKIITCENYNNMYRNNANPQAEEEYKNLLRRERIFENVLELSSDSSKFSVGVDANFELINQQNNDFVVVENNIKSRMKLYEEKQNKMLGDIYNVNDILEMLL